MLTAKTHGHLRPRADRSGLVLQRQEGQGIIIATSDGEIEIVVKSVHGRRVKFGVLAPPEVHIRRDELPARDQAIEEAA